MLSQDALDLEFADLAFSPEKQQLYKRIYILFAAQHVFMAV